jgi:hypothetical protein
VEPGDREVAGPVAALGDLPEPGEGVQHRGADPDAGGGGGMTLATLQERGWPDREWWEARDYGTTDGVLRLVG